MVEPSPCRKDGEAGQTGVGLAGLIMSTGPRLVVWYHSWVTRARDSILECESPILGCVLWAG